MNTRIGIIGTGVMGTAHAETISAHTARTEIVAICDPDESRAANVASRVNCPNVYTDPFELIGRADVDAVLVASPDETHFELASACIKAGKPVLCEKPLATNAVDCMRLVELGAATGRELVQVGFMRRFDPLYAELKEAFAKGVIGKALIVRCVHRNAVAPWFFVPGMSILNAMVHEIDICRWLLGTEFRRIRIDRIPEAKSDDPILATLETTAGGVVSIEVFMNAGYGYDIRTEIVGQEGVLVMGHPPMGSLVSTSAGYLPFPSDFRVRFADAYRIQFQAWIDAVVAGINVGASAWDGFVASFVAEAGLRSFTSGGWEEIVLPERISSTGVQKAAL